MIDRVFEGIYGKIVKRVKGSSLALYYNVGISFSHDSWLPEEAYNQEVRGKYISLPQQRTKLDGCHHNIS